MTAVTLAEAERRINELRAFENEYRSRIRAYLEGLLRDLEASSGPAFEPADFTLAALVDGPAVIDRKHCEWRGVPADKSLLSALSLAQGHDCPVAR